MCASLCLCVPPSTNAVYVVSLIQVSPATAATATSSYSASVLKLLGRDYRAGVFLPQVLQHLIVAYSAFAGQLQHVLGPHRLCLCRVCATRRPGGEWC